MLADQTPQVVVTVVPLTQTAPAPVKKVVTPKPKKPAVPKVPKQPVVKPASPAPLVKPATPTPLVKPAPRPATNVPPVPVGVSPAIAALLPAGRRVCNDRDLEEMIAQYNSYQERLLLVYLETDFDRYMRLSHLNHFSEKIGPVESKSFREGFFPLVVATNELACGIVMAQRTMYDAIDALTTEALGILATRHKYGRDFTQKTPIILEYFTLPLEKFRADFEIYEVLNFVSSPDLIEALIYFDRQCEYLPAYRKAKCKEVRVFTLTILKDRIAAMVVPHTADRYDLSLYKSRYPEVMQDLQRRVEAAEETVLAREVEQLRQKEICQSYSLQERDRELALALSEGKRKDVKIKELVLTNKQLLEREKELAIAHSEGKRKDVKMKELVETNQELQQLASDTVSRQQAIAAELRLLKRAAASAATEGGESAKKRKHTDT